MLNEADVKTAIKLCQKLKPHKNLGTEKKAFSPEQENYLAELLRLLTRAAWPGVTSFGLISWPSDRCAALRFPYNAHRINTVLSK